MKNKIIVLIALYLLVNDCVYSQNIKPMSPSMDINGQKIEIYSTNNILPYKSSSLEPVEQSILDSKPSENKVFEVIEKPVNNVSSEKESAPVIEIKENPVKKNNDSSEKSLVGSVESAVVKKSEPVSTAHNSSIINQAVSIENELRSEEKHTLNNLRTLWAAAVEKSTTIRLAIQKLSNPEEGTNTNQGTVSKLLSPIASIAPLAAMASSSATQTAGALLGGGLLGTIASPEDSQYNNYLKRISDYDLIMLAKAVDELQNKLVMVYYDYYNSNQRMLLAEEALKRAQSLVSEAQKTDNFTSNTAADAFYRQAMQENIREKENYLRARADLEQLTGIEAIDYIENHKEDDKTSDVQDKSTEGMYPELPARVKEELKSVKVLEPKSNLTQESIIPSVTGLKEDPAN